MLVYKVWESTRQTAPQPFLIDPVSIVPDYNIFDGCLQDLFWLSTFTDILHTCSISINASTHIPMHTLWFTVHKMTLLTYIWWQACKDMQLLHKLCMQVNLCVNNEHECVCFPGEPGTRGEQFSLREQRKITHLLVQLLQISVLETQWLAEQRAPFIKWLFLTLVNYSNLFWPRFRQGITPLTNRQSGKNITVNSHQ